MLGSLPFAEYACIGKAEPFNDGTPKRSIQHQALGLNSQIHAHHDQVFVVFQPTQQPKKVTPIFPLSHSTRTICQSALLFHYGQLILGPWACQFQFWSFISELSENDSFSGLKQSLCNFFVNWDAKFLTFGSESQIFIIGQILIINLVHLSSSEQTTIYSFIY